MPGTDRTREHLVSLAIFAVALSIYLTFLTAHYSYDSVGGGILLYQWMAHGKVEQLFQRYHILYLAAAAGVEMILTRVGVELDPLTLLQLLSATFAAGSVAVFHRLARALGLGVGLSATLTVLLGGGFCFWYYATTGESYPISLFFLLLGFLSAVRAAPAASWRRSALPGVWLGLAVCFHGTCVLALPGLVVVSWPSTDAPPRWRPVFGAMAATMLVIGIPYVTRYALRPGGVIGADASVFAAESGWTFPPRLLSEWRSLAYFMVFPDWPGFSSGHPGLAKLSGLSLLAMTLLPLTLLFKPDAVGRRHALAIGVWFAASFIFFSTYYPGTSKFAAYQWTPLLLLVGFAIQHIARQRTSRLVAVPLLATIVAVTVFCSFDLVRRQTDIESNAHLMRARAIGRLTQPDDVIVHLGRGADQFQNAYTPYFAARRSLSLEQSVARAHRTAAPTVASIEASVRSAVAAAGRVVVVSDALDSGASSLAFERDHRLPEGSLARMFAAHDPRLLGEDPAVGSLWVLTR